MIKFLFELLGTFMLVLVFLNAGTAVPDIAIPVAIIVGGVIYFAGPVSGANINPAVSLIQNLNGKLTTQELLYYWIAQFTGAILALYFHKSQQKIVNM